jgi:multisubunit Na+/H+ antiporter MnhF subunit
MTEDRLRSRAILWALALALALAGLVMGVWTFLMILGRPIPSELWQLVTIVVNGVTIAGIFKLMEKQV